MQGLKEFKQKCGCAYAWTLKSDLSESNALKEILLCKTVRKKEVDEVQNLRGNHKKKPVGHEKNGSHVQNRW